MVRVSTEDLRGGVGGGSGHGVGGGLETTGDTGNTEIPQLRSPIRGDQDVGGFDIAVHDARAVREVQGAGELDSDGEDIGYR